MTLKNIMIAALMVTTLVSASWAEKINDHWTVTFGERMRLESWDNTMSFDETAADSRTYTRNRTQLGAVWSPSSNLTFGARLGNEFRYYMAPKNIDFHLNEVFIDQLYGKLILPWYKTMTLTVGRQDIILGEGFIVMDGGPLDGSRSGYFNAARLDWTIRPDHVLTAFVSHLEETDAYLPIIHDQHQALVEQPESGLGLYFSGTGKQREIHGYVIRKDYRDNAAFPFTANVNSLGGRIKQKVSGVDMTAVLEAAYQFGERGNADRGAYGGYGYLQYRPAWRTPRWYLPTSVTAGFLCLSGDDPGTGDWEGWDPLFGRWPKWSDSYIYAEIKEDAVAYWTNLISLNIETKFQVTPAVELRLAYQHLTAPQAADTLSAFPGGTGTARGELFIGKFSYKFDQRWSGHLLYECLDPGDYYFDGADDYVWFRAELTYQY
ncbi:MAG: alginate export family protein [candidate division Zixibacteria bacterium]|nr:alginate export family protein [candidate division Zixibacteria bacterium]